MQGNFQLFIFTTDRDLGEHTPYKGIVTDQWIEYSSGVQILYNSPAQLNYRNIRNQVASINPDVIYLNSMFSRFFTIYPLLMTRGKARKVNIVLSPRGMLRKSALQFKPLKKKVYLSLFKALGFNKSIRFHATDEQESKDIQLHFGKQAQVTLISNFPGAVKAFPAPLEKQPGKLKVLFVGRIHPIKNLDYLLSILPNVKGEIHLTVTGSEEDKEYAQQCRAFSQGLPAHITVTFNAEMPHHELAGIFMAHHIFALPTMGENFGHAIFEALAFGKPVLISDQTPWRDLPAKKAGWDLPLNDKAAFIQALQQAADFDQAEYNRWSEGAWEHAKRSAAGNSILAKYITLFNANAQ